MARLTEKVLDRAIELAFKENAAFTEWFLSHTKFKDDKGIYYWSRSDNPWGPVELEIPSAETGVSETVIRESETDILVVFQTPAGRRFALHIENKIDSPFTAWQPELYAARAKKWKGNPRYGNYDDWETVLIAPTAYVARHAAESAKFDRFISHEDIAAHVPLFGLRELPDLARLVVSTMGRNLVGLRELCQKYCEARWVAAHMTPAQTAESLLDEFKRAVRQELELLEVKCVDGGPIGN